MESQIERISPVECRVRVEIPWEQVSTRLDKKLRDVRRRARVPGFRQGKVPAGMIEKMFGQSVRAELAEEMVEETFTNAVGEHSLTPLTRPVVEDSKLEKGQPFSYSALFEVPPEIEPVGYEGVEVRRRPAAADPAKVDALIQGKRDELTELVPLGENPGREKTQKGDIWICDLDGQFGEQSLSRRDLQVEIEGETPDFIPGLSEQLADFELSKVGSSVTLSFTPPQDRLRDEFKGLECNVTLGLREVKVREVPELDDDFAKDTGDAESLDELRAKYTEHVLQEDQDEAEREARERLVRSLLDANEFEPAPSMIAQEVAAQVDAMRRQYAAQGISLAQLGMSEQQLAANIRPQAMFAVKAFLLLNAIGKKEEIEISSEDLDAEVAKVAEERGQNVQRVRAQMEKNNELLLLQAQMREEKILDLLMEKAKVTEAPDPEPEAAAEPTAESSDK